MAASGPKDSYYYDLLEVPFDAPADAIRRKYYLAALKYHPDKNLDNPLEAEQKFKEVAEAYQILSDPLLRQRYDEFGRNSETGGVGDGNGPPGGFADPREVFRQMFGGDPFVDIIGEISLALLLSDVYEESLKQEQSKANEAEAERVAAAKARAGNPVAALGNGETTAGPSDSTAKTAAASAAKSQPSVMDGFLTPERQAQLRVIRQQRVAHLAEKLQSKLALFVDGLYTAPEFVEYASKEAQILSHESFGAELLHAVGYVYWNKAKQYLGRTELLGLSSLYHSLREKGHIISEFVSTVNAARDVYSDVKREGQRQERLGAAPAASRAAASDQTATIEISETKIKKAMCKAAGMEVESVIREVCDVVLSKQPSAILHRRATALKILGNAYRHVKESSATTEPS